MKWDVVVEAWLARLFTDPALISLLGGEHVYSAQASRPVRVPSVEYSFLYDREGEWLNPFGLQVDYWMRGIKKAAQLEKRLRLLSHADYAQELGGERLWFRYLDSRSLDFPSDPGVTHRTLDFQVDAVRLKYS